MSAPGPARSASSTRDDWETPPELYDQLHAEFRFTLDAAAGPANARCSEFLSGPCMRAFSDDCDCGLCANWQRHAVWCNPPYGLGLLAWVGKFTEASTHATIVALLPANTDTVWFAQVFKGADELRFLTARVQFLIDGKIPRDANGKASGNTGGSFLAIYRPTQPELFKGPAATLWDWRGKP